MIGRNDILASNYHVISGVVNEPDRYRLEWESVDGRRGPLTVLAVNVVHNLALLRAEEPMGIPLQTTRLPENGTSLFHSDIHWRWNWLSWPALPTVCWKLPFTTRFISPAISTPA